MEAGSAYGSSLLEEAECLQKSAQLLQGTAALAFLQLVRHAKVYQRLSPSGRRAFLRVEGVCRVVLLALLTAFLLIVQSSNDYQCLHVAPGIDCLVHPGWALWCAYGASFAWLALAILALIGAPAASGHDQLLPGPRSPGARVLLALQLSAAMRCTTTGHADIEDVPWSSARIRVYPDIAGARRDMSPVR